MVLYVILLRLKNIGGEQKPKIVLWFFTASNDLFEQRDEWNNEILKRYLIQKDYKQGLKQLQDDIDNAYKAYADLQINDLYGTKAHLRKVIQRIFLFGLRDFVDTKVTNITKKRKYQLAKSRFKKSF